MRSTPIILDRIRHIRYDLQAIWDMDHIMTGGFLSILEKEVTFELCQSVLWFGLKSEDPHLTKADTRKLMEEAGITETEFVNVFTTCSKELFNSGWFYTPQPEDDGTVSPDKTETESPSIQKHILDLIRMGYTSGLTDHIWEYTPAEIEDRFLVMRSKEKQDNVIKDFRMGTICSVIANAMLKKNGGGVFTWQDFVPHEEIRQTPEEMLSLIQATNAAMGGVTNG